MGQDGSVWAQSASFPQVLPTRSPSDSLICWIASRFFFLIWFDLNRILDKFDGFGALFKPEEVTNIINDFNEPGTLAPIGLFLGSAKYMVIQGEAGAVIRGKKCNMVVERLGDYLIDQGL
ncbi:hypothetical protein B296_00031190 [Ensete ventricosum]|uniref:Profilin n=1 Tax=Ensete ventricosum TaxID=4639 RepID=A0A427AGW0_ENSVE|nr:hypothetical protein B296_00031190 [Ensete ventricosum]